MSADSWARCPKCADVLQKKLADRESKINDSYGKVQPLEFIESLEQLNRDKKAAENMTPTFREDYQVTGAADGLVIVTYSGHCTVKDCGLTLKFEVVRPLYP